jgi:hypothetical protein
MFLRISKGLQINNLNGYPAEIVSQLESLLRSGAIARVDPKRVNFFDVETAGRVFFIHAAPGSGKVMLLATWPVESPRINADNEIVNRNGRCVSLEMLPEASTA